MKRTIIPTAVALFVIAQVWPQHETARAADSTAKSDILAEQNRPRRWQVTTSRGLRMYEAPATDAAVIEMLKTGAILSNLGCKQSGNQIWCRVKPLRSRLRGYVTAHALRPARGPDGIVPTGADTSARRARQGDFDATGILRCAQNRGQSLSQCKFAVARSGGGDATVVVTFSNGFKRTLYFAHGVFIRANTTMSGVGYDTDWRIEGELHMSSVSMTNAMCCSMRAFSEGSCLTADRAHILHLTSISELSFRCIAARKSQPKHRPRLIKTGCLSLQLRYAFVARISEAKR